MDSHSRGGVAGLSIGVSLSHAPSLEGSSPRGASAGARNKAFIFNDIAHDINHTAPANWH